MSQDNQTLRCPQASRRALLMGLAAAATPMAPALASAFGESAPAELAANDERVLALIRRSLVATRALYSAHDRLGDCDVEDCSPEVQREIERLHEATDKPLAELAELAEQDKLLADWLEIDMGPVGRNANWPPRSATSSSGGQE
jgi:hypothetical protein